MLTAQARIALHHNMLDIAKRTLDSRAKHVRANAAVVGDEDFTRSQLADITWREGELAARKGDYQTAQAKADELARLIEPQTDPRKMEGHHQLMGLMHLLQGKNQEAVDHFRQANKDNPYVKYHLALALEGTGNTAEARKLFREVANWNFNNAAYACIRNDAMARLKSAQA